MKNSNYLTDDEYEFIYSRSPRICVDLLIKNSKGEILLTKRDIEPYKDHWHFPGGRIKFRETVEDAINRVLKAELGLEYIGVPKMIGFCQFLDEEQKGQPRHSISLVHHDQAKEVGFFKSIPDPIIPPQFNFLVDNLILWK